MQEESSPYELVEEFKGGNHQDFDFEVEKVDKKDKESIMTDEQNYSTKEFEKKKSKSKAQCPERIKVIEHIEDFINEITCEYLF